jgi:integrase
VAARDHRLGAAVALLFLQGWRVSEVLGLAWEDLDLDAGTALVGRASVYVDGRGQQLGPPKTEGARGEHWLMPTVAALLEKRRAMQDEERASAPAWATITYGGEPINLVFTNPLGGLVLRQAVAKVVKQAAKTAGITAHLGCAYRAAHGRDHAVRGWRRGIGGHRPFRRPCSPGDHGRLREAPRAPSPRRRSAGCGHPRRRGRGPGR